MTIQSAYNTHPIENTPLPLLNPERRAKLSRQVKSITNILILMLCHMAANATVDRQHAAYSNGDGVVQRAAPLTKMYVAPLLNTSLTSNAALAAQETP